MLVQTAENSNVLAACKLTHLLRIDLADKTRLLLARGEYSDQFGTYKNWIKSIGELKHSLTNTLDRVSVVCQNISGQLGAQVAADEKFFEYALCEYVIVRRGLRSPFAVLAETQFVAVIANAGGDETETRFDLIADYDAVGTVIAARALDSNCWWIYKNGVECTSPSALPTCPKNRLACIARAAEHQFGGWEPIEDVPATPPDSGDDGIGGGGYDPYRNPGGDIIYY